MNENYSAFKILSDNYIENREDCKELEKAIDTIDKLLDIYYSYNTVNDATIKVIEAYNAGAKEAFKAGFNAAVNLILNGR